MTIKRKLEKTKVFIMDVDGVLTEGEVYLGTNNFEMKRFNVKDGHGIKMLIRAGIKTGIITGRKSNIVGRRAKELGIHFIYQGVADKQSVLSSIMKKYGFKLSDIAYIGDDLPDIPVMLKVGISIAVADAVKEVKEIADYVTKNKGGRGAVREVSEMILKSKGIFNDQKILYYT